MSRVRKGAKHKEETKRKISASLKGNPNLRTWSGRKHTEEYKQHMRELRTGYKMSEETKEKVRQANLGKHISDEVKHKQSEAMKNKLWYNNGVVRLRIKEGDPIPEGFVRGRGSHYTEESNSKRSKKLLGKVFWNNGAKNIRARECPGEGFVRGRGSF